MAGRRIGEAFIRVRPDTGGFVAEAHPQAELAGTGLGGAFAGAFTKAFGLISVALGGVFAAGKALETLKESVQLASDLGETTSAVRQIFGESADAVVAFAEKANRSLGQTRTQALNAANTFATFGKSAGLTGQDLVDFSTKMVGLTADLASFRNTTPEEAIEAVGAALRGESEPIRRYGVLLDDATLRQRALTLGIVSTTREALTPQQRVLAAQAEILAQTSDAQGDFTRTSNGLANQQRITSALIGDFKVKIGELLLPAVNGIVSAFNNQLLPVIEQRVIPALGSLRDWFVVHVVPVIRDQVVPAIRDEIIPALQNLGHWVADEVVPRLQAFWGWLQEKVLPVLEDIRQRGLEQLLPALQRVRDTFNDNESSLRKLWDAFTRVADLVATYVLPLLGPAFTNALIIVETTIRLLITTIGAAVRAFQWLSDTAHDVVFFFRDLKDQLIAFLSDAGHWLVDAGQAIVRGLWDGIKSLGGWLWNNITNFVSANVPGPVKKLLGIASPSKLFRELGRDTIRGFVLGVQSEAVGIESAIAAALPGAPGGAPIGASAQSAGGNVQNIFNLVGPSVAELAAQVAREQAWTRGA